MYSHNVNGEPVSCTCNGREVAERCGRSFHNSGIWDHPTVFCLHKKKPLRGTGVKENQGPRDIRALASVLITSCILNWGVVGSKVTSSFLSILCEVVSGLGDVWMDAGICSHTSNASPCGMLDSGLVELS